MSIESSRDPRVTRVVDTTQCSVAKDSVPWKCIAETILEKDGKDFTLRLRSEYNEDKDNVSFFHVRKERMRIIEATYLAVKEHQPAQAPASVGGALSQYQPK